MKLSAVALTVVAVLAVTASAAADQQIATGPVEPAPEPPPPALDIDARGPVRVGLGTSRLFDSRVLSLSFEDEIDIWRLSRGAMLGVVFGLDAQRAMESKIVDRGFLSTGFGPELALRMPRQGPLFVLSGTAAPLWQSDASATSLAGLGVSFRAEAFPFVANSVWFRDVYGARVHEAARGLSDAAADAARSRGAVLDLWETARAIAAACEAAD